MIDASGARVVDAIKVIEATAAIETLREQASRQFRRANPGNGDVMIGLTARLG
jgi:hypothetical protein